MLDRYTLLLACYPERVPPLLMASNAMEQSTGKLRWRMLELSILPDA